MYMKLEKSHLNAFIAIAAVLMLSNMAFSQATFQTAMGTFSTSRSADETFTTDIIVNGGLRASSTGQNILMPGIDSTNLPEDVFICPGNINLSISPQVFWAYSQFTTTCSYPVNKPRAAPGYVNNRDVPILLNDTLYGRITSIEYTPSNPFYATMLMPALEDVGYINITGSSSVLGRSRSGLVCNGTYSINGNSFKLLSPISGTTIGQPTGSFIVNYPSSSLGQKTATANLAINNCKGIVETFSEDATGGTQRKYIFKESTAVGISSNAQFKFTISNPQSISPQINSISPSALSIGAGESADVNFTLTNNADVAISIESAALSNGFTITGKGNWADPIAPGAAGVKKTATITSPAITYTGSVTGSLNFSTSVPVCNGSILSNSAGLSIANNPNMTCILNSTMLAGLNYTVQQGGTYPIQAQCYDSFELPTNCGNGFAWTTNLSGVSMAPTPTTADPHTSNLVVSGTAVPQTGYARATHTANARVCNFAGAQEITVVVDPNATSCALSSLPLALNNYIAIPGNSYFVNILCYNRAGFPLPTCGRIINWATNITNATMNPNPTTHPPDFGSFLEIGSVAPLQTGRNVNATEATGNFSCSLPSMVNVTYLMSCSIGVPPSVFLNNPVSPGATFTYPFTGDVFFDCGNSKTITLSCTNNTVVTTCSPKDPINDRCAYSAAGTYTLRTTHGILPPITCSANVNIIMNNGFGCRYYI